jgi:hypothetical protein
MPDTQPVVAIALLQQQVSRMEEHINFLDKQIEDLKAERNNVLKWGVGTLGAGLLAVCSLIFNYVKDHLK